MMPTTKSDATISSEIIEKDSLKIWLMAWILLIKEPKEMRLLLHNFYNPWFLVNHIVKKQKLALALKWEVSVRKWILVRHFDPDRREMMVGAGRRAGHAAISTICSGLSQGGKSSPIYFFCFCATRMGGNTRRPVFWNSVITIRID